MGLLIQVENVFAFRYDPECLYPNHFVFYEITYGKRTTFTGVPSMTEETCLSLCSHEAIEMVLGMYEMLDEQWLKDNGHDEIGYNIHCIIGFFPDSNEDLVVEIIPIETHTEIFADRILTDEHYANNVDGLPNLPYF